MTEAAATLHVAQSAVSTSIGDLERRLGTPLFVRRRAKGLVLTAAGETFLVRTRRILADIDDAMATVDPGHVAGLSASEVESALADHAVEVALTCDLGMGASVHRERLRTVPLYVAVGPGHRLADRDRVYPFELANEPMVLLDLPHSRDYFTEIFTRRGLAPVVRHRFTSFEAVRAMVARGHGFTLLNQRPVHDLTYDGGRLVVIQLTEDAGRLDVVLASTQPASTLSRRAQAFVEQCRAVVGTAPEPPDASVLQK